MQATHTRANLLVACFRKQPWLTSSLHLHSLLMSEQSLILNLLDDYLTIWILALVVSATSLGAQHSEAMASMWRYAVSR